MLYKIEMEWFFGEGNHLTLVAHLCIFTGKPYMSSECDLHLFKCI